MREMWSRRLAVLTGILVVLLSVAFAIVQNPVVGPPAPAAPRLPGPERQAAIEAGRQVYDTQGCGRCHSIAGEGNARSPLDGIGDRHAAADIRKWIVAAPELKEQLPPRAFAAKQDYGGVDREDLDALVAYLLSLRSDGTGE